MFASKTNQTIAMSVGVKGSDVFDSTGSALLDLSVRLVRGADPIDIASRIRGVTVMDAFVLAFHTRNIRGGKGERDLFKAMYLELYKAEPEMATDLLDLVPHYGRWDDLFALAIAEEGLHDHALTIAINQLLNDQDAPLIDEDGNPVSISLVAKWAPRESRADPKERSLAQTLAVRLFPGVRPFSAQMKAYRKLVSGLNRRLDTVETHMCGGTWSAIKPQSVPGRAGHLYGRALLNLSSTFFGGKHTKLYGSQKGEIRKSQDQDRIVCRANFEEHFAAAASAGQGAKVHGADTLMPHELVKKALTLLHMDSEADSQAEKDQVCAVWRSMVEKVKGQGGLGRSIMMSDFSGSMQSAGSAGDTPYWVSMALGLLGAECCTGEFTNRFMTFDSKPTWHHLPTVKAEGSPSDLFDRLASIKESIGQGLSTDFQAAMDLVLATLKEKRVRPGEEPENLIVLTDMAWDQACGSLKHHVKHADWETHIEMIRESFKRTGEEMWGSADVPGGLGGWAMPRIVIWNLSASQGQIDFHATADTPGVAMLSGWSAAQFKVLCQLGPRQLTPLEILRVELDDPQYDRVRERVAMFITYDRIKNRGCSCDDDDVYVSHSNGFGACSSACSCA